MTERCETVGDWKIRVCRTENGDYPKYRIEARDDAWGRYEETFTNDLDDGLRKIAGRTDLDTDELLITFGLRV